MWRSDSSHSFIHSSMKSPFLGTYFGALCSRPLAPGSLHRWRWGEPAEGPAERML